MAPVLPVCPRQWGKEREREKKQLVLLISVQATEGGRETAAGSMTLIG